MMEYLRRVLPVGKFLSAVFMGWLLMMAYTIYMKSGPNLIIFDIQTIDDTVKASPDGDTIAFYVKEEITKQCPGTVSRYVWRWVLAPDGERVREYHSIDNPPLSPEPGIGKHNFIITLRVQGGLTRGEQWYERTNVLPNCGLFSWVSFNTPIQRDHPIKAE